MNWWIAPAWRDILASEHLATLPDVLAYRGASLLSSKRRSRTWRHQLPDGQVLFIKQDSSTDLRTSLRALLHFQRPLTATGREFRKIEKLASLGFYVPSVIACGSNARFGLPHTGAIIMLPVKGQCVEKLLNSPEISQERRQLLLERCKSLLAQLQEAGCDWKKDCKPEHFFITDDNQLSIIDVERMHFQRGPLSTETREAQWKRFMSFVKQ